MKDESPRLNDAAPIVYGIAARRATYKGFSLASLMLVVTLASLICGLTVLAPGLGLVAIIISLPSVARLAVIRRHIAPTKIGAVIDTVTDFGTSCCVITVIAVAAGICGLAACWAAGYPSGIVAGLVSGPGTRGGDPYAPMLITGLGVGLITGTVAGVALAYFLLLRSLTFPVPKQALSRRDKAFLILILTLTTVVGGVGLLLILASYQ